MEAHVSSEASSPLTSSGTDVVILVALDGVAGEQDIPITSTLMSAVLSKREVEPKLLRDKSGLILFGLAAFETDNLLERNDICLEFVQNVHDPVRPNTSVHTTTFVDVVGNDS